MQIADYDAALKLFPKSPYWLYGRGVAKLKTGDAAGGNADIIAAKAIWPGVADEFVGHGIPAPEGAASSTPAPRTEAASAASTQTAATASAQPLPPAQLQPGPLPPAQLKQATLPPVMLPQASVKEIFEKHQLLGIFAPDCGKPASKDNWYFVNRLLDGGQVQRDMMTGPTTRAWVAVLDKAAEVKPNEIAVSGTREGQPVDGIWRLGDGRMEQWEASKAGQKEISAGRMVDTGKELPPLHKCASPG